MAYPIGRTTGENSVVSDGLPTRPPVRRLLPVASFLASHLRSAVRAVVTFLGPDWDGPGRKYRPEQHYMRGPGPKWREKHFYR
jgi:hypothetical protein